jgi:hypothetical protein
MCRTLGDQTGFVAATCRGPVVIVRGEVNDAISAADLGCLPILL